MKEIGKILISKAKELAALSKTFLKDVWKIIK